MSAGYSRFIPFISFSGEIFILNLLFVVGFVWLYPAEKWHAENLLLYIYTNGVWGMISYSTRSFDIHRHTKLGAIIFNTTNNIVLFFFIFLLYFQFRNVNYYSRDELKVVFVLFIIILFIWKCLLHFGFHQYRKLGYNFRNVLFIGVDKATMDLYNMFLSNPWHGYRCLGFIGDFVPDELTKLGSFQDLPSVLAKQRPDEVYVAYNSLSNAEKENLVMTLSRFPIQVSLVPDIGKFTYQSIEWRDLGHTSVMVLHSGPLSFLGNRFIKRGFDLIFSLIMIVFLLSWLIPLLLLLDLFTYRNGIFYTQLRTSINGRTFRIVKFRSMVHNDLADKQQAVENDRRITKMGAFLRKTNIDELPQFFNVFLGQMSVIGPRPHMLAHTEEYSRQVASYMLRHVVKPGITGLAQVHGFRGEVRSVADIQKRVEKDIEYIKRWSIWIDLAIIFKTALLIMKELIYPQKRISEKWKKRSKKKKVLH